MYEIKHVDGRGNRRRAAIRELAIYLKTNAPAEWTLQQKRSLGKEFLIKKGYSANTRRDYLDVVMAELEQ